MTQITLKVKQFSKRGLYIYLPRKYFHLGQEIHFEVDEDLIKGVGEQNKIEISALKADLKRELIEEIAPEISKQLKGVPSHVQLMEIQRKLDKVIAFEQR